MHVQCSVWACLVALVGSGLVGVALARLFLGVTVATRLAFSCPAFLRGWLQGLPLRETLQILYKIRRDKFLVEMFIFLLYFAVFLFIVLEVRPRGVGCGRFCGCPKLPRPVLGPAPCMTSCPRSCDNRRTPRPRRMNKTVHCIRWARCSFPPALTVVESTGLVVKVAWPPGCFFLHWFPLSSPPLSEQTFLDQEIPQSVYKKTFWDISNPDDYWNWVNGVLLVGAFDRRHCHPSGPPVLPKSPS